MANDASPANSGGQKVNIDSLEVEILIIAKLPNSMRGAIQFLNRKGWNTTVQSNLGKAVEEIAARRPDIVLISFNHNSPAIGKLPELIVQTFNTTCIGFVEMNDSTSNSKLTTRKIRYKIFGQASGPNLYRGIARMLAERYDLDLNDKVGEVLDVKGNKENTSPGRVAVVDAKKPEVKASGVAVIDSSKRKKLKDIAGTSFSEDASGNLLFGESLDAKGGAATAPPKEGPSNADIVSMLKRSLFGEGKEDVPEDSSGDDMAKATEKAFAKICKKDPKGKTKPVRLVSKVVVYPFDGGESSGYLVLVLNGNSETLVRTLENSLQATMTSMNIKGKIDAGFIVTLPEIDFDSWTSSSAAFSMKIDNLGQEMGVAFFPTGKIPKPSLPNSEGMLTVPLADLPVDEPVPFKAYIHMRQNQKYYLYLRNGRRLQPEQKERLEGRKVSEIFMKTVDGENLKTFFAVAFLKQTMRNSGEEVA